MRFILLASAFALSACVTVPADAPEFSRLDAPANGMSNVYVYRFNADPSLHTPVISFDGEVVRRLPEGGYFVTQLPMGQHDMLIDWGWSAGPPDLDFTFDVVGPETFIKVTGEVTFGYNTTNWPTKVFVTNDGAAIAEMMYCCREVPIDAE